MLGITDDDRVGIRSSTEECALLYANKIKNKLLLIDDLNIDGDFVESQAFAFLAIRSYLKLPISFPNTTGCKKPITGGEIIKST